MKVAIPVFGESLEVFERTGQAPFFAVFEINEDKSFNLLELRKNSKGHEHHHEGESHSHNEEEHTNEHNKQASGISDCEYIFVKRIGEHMRESLNNMNIKIKMFRKKDGDNAKDYIQKFISE